MSANPIKFVDDETKFAGEYSEDVLRTLKQAYAPYFASCIVLLIIGFIGRILLMANANIIGLWVDSLCASPNHCAPIPSYAQNLKSIDFLLLLGGATTSGLLCTLVFRIAFSRLSARAVSQIYDEVTLRTSRLPMSFYDSTPVGRIVTRFTSDYGNVFRLFGGPLAEFIGIIFDILAMVVLVSFASPYYLVICALIACLNYLVYRMNRARLRRYRRDLSRNRSPSIAHFAETAQGVTTIRTFGRQPTFFKRFSKLNLLYLNQRLATTFQLLSFSFQMNALTAALLLFTGIMAFYLVQKSILSVGSVGVAFSFIALSGNTLQMFFDWVAQFEEAMIGVERLDQYLRHPLEEGSRLPAGAQFETGQAKALEQIQLVDLTPKVSAEVEIKNLNFRYRADLPLVLKNINFKILAGERIGIVGRTGSGKTSLIQVLFHLYPIETGSISIDGFQARINETQDCAKNSPHNESHFVDLELYRKSIALIPQDPTLFKGSLRENLSLDQSKTDTDLIANLERVGLKDWFSELPSRLETQIEERGRNLSQGEKQLICMARCLLQDCPIVIMDEATSNIDPHSEEILVRATNDFFKQRTQIIVAHRLSTIENCDRILWLQNGEIKKIGIPGEVLPEFRKHST